MTMPPQDAPDWSGIPAGARLVGHLTVAGATTFVDVVTGPNDGALLCLFANLPTTLDGFSFVELSTTGVGPIVQVQPIFTVLPGNAGPMVFPAPSQLTTAWRVTLSLNTGSPQGDVYIFALPAYPTVQVATPGAGLRVAPVMTPSRDFLGVPKFSSPAVNAVATCTWTGVFGYRWVLDSASWIIRTSAAVSPAVAIQVQDGGTTVWNSNLSTPATSGAIDRETLGPLAGIPASDGADLSIGFAAAGGANTIERCAGVAWQVPSGLFAY